MQFYIFLAISNLLSLSLIWRFHIGDREFSKGIAVAESQTQTQGSQILIFLRKTSVFRDQPHIFLVYLITHILPHVLEKDSWLPHDSRISWKLHFKRIFSENFLNFSKYSSNKVLFFTNFLLLSMLLGMGEWAKIGKIQVL